MKTQQTVVSIAILDWYDGVVSGVVQTQETWALAALLAFEPDERRRLYAIVEIPETTALDWVANPPGTLSLAQIRLDSESTYISLNEPDLNEDLVLRSATQDEMDMMLAANVIDIDHAVQPEAIAYWLQT